MEKLQLSNNSFGTFIACVLLMLLKLKIALKLLGHFVFKRRHHLIQFSRQSPKGRYCYHPHFRDKKLWVSEVKRLA